MYLFENAIKNIKRNKGRYFLVGGVITIALVLVTVSIMISFSTKKVIKDYVEKFNTKVYFTHDLKKVIKLPSDDKGMINVPEISTDQFLSFADSMYVKKALFTGSFHGFSNSFIGLDQGEQELEDSGFSSLEEMNVDDRQMPNCTVIGYSDLSLIEEFELEQRTIDNGRMFQEKDECIVSVDFAKLNNLEVGDKINLYNVDDIKQELFLTISGTYLDITKPQQDNSNWAVNNTRNQILVSYDTLIARGYSSVYTKATYYLDNPDDGLAFEGELRKKGLSELYIVNIDADNYYQIVEPIKGLARISNITMIAILGFSSIILVFLSVLLAKERKYEIGVLRTIGMSKSKVAAGMLIETFVITILCLVLGLSIGAAIAQPISNNILSEQLKLSQKTYTASEINYGIKVTSQAKEEVNYHGLARVYIGLESNIIVLVSGIAILLGLVSNSIGLIYLLKFEPMKILTERE